MRTLLLTIFTLLISSNLFSQCIKGKVINTNGTPISFATIYAPDLSKGTTSNVEGNYFLDLPNGEHKLVVRNLGYKTKEIIVDCNGEQQQLDIILEEQLYKIPEVRILASGEDPAYAIMRKAVAMSHYYLNQVGEYDCRIYMKGSGKFENIPRIMKKTLKKEGIEEDKAMVMENITDLHFELPDVVEENVISMRSTMKNEEVSPMGYITLSLYNDIEGIISPLRRDAFAHYKFELLASFYDQDFLIHKIKIIPRREGFDLYSGNIYIVEGFWHLHSAELEVEQKMFKLKLNQVYSPVSDDVWMPISHTFDVDVNAMGFEINFKYVASVSDYKVKLNPNIDHSLYRNLLSESKEYMAEIDNLAGGEKEEIKELVQKEYLTKKESRKLKKLVRKDIEDTKPKEKDLEERDNISNVEDSALLRTVTYWDTIRPIPLTMEEMEGYKVKDSIQHRMESDTTYRDSIERDDKKFKWGKLLTGGTFRYDNGHRFRYGGLIDFDKANFNTVDGLKYGMEFQYTHRSDSSAKYFSIWNDVNYAFAREEFTGNLSIYHRYNGLKRAYFRLRAGRTTSDFDSQTGISENLNLITTLFLKENYLKLYQKDYITIQHATEITNGLRLFAGFEYAHRKQLFNNSDYYFYNPFDNEFTPNIPPVENFNPELVKDHNASILSVNMSYTPEYYYRFYDGVKYNTRSRFPTFTLNYTKGISGLLNSDVDYDQLEFNVRQRLNLRRIGTFRYSLTTGSFLNNSKVYFADYKHFGTNYPFLIGTSEGSTFRLIDYYDYSTSNSYFEAHARVENDRILLKRLPVLNKTLMRETVYFNYLSTTESKPYYEVGYGLNQIFLMFNLEVFAGFKGQTHEYTGIKIGIPFVGRNGDSITIGG